MALSVYIKLTIAGSSVGPFNFYSDVDSYTTPFETNISVASLIAGYTSVVVPNGTTTIELVSIGTCSTSPLFLTIQTNTATPNPTASQTSTPSPSSTSIIPTSTTTITLPFQTPLPTETITGTPNPTSTIAPTPSPTITLPYPTQASIAVSFTQIPSTTDVVDYGRALESWYDGWAVPYPTSSSPQSGNCFSEYYRFEWGHIENMTSLTSTYSWTFFDTKIKHAIDNKRLFNFAVMPYYSGAGTAITVGGGILSYPTYLHNQMQSETVKDWINTSENAWVPDWNSNYYLTAWENLQNAIANHIATSSYKPSWSTTPISYSLVIGYIDIRGYGNFGEWHTYPWSSEITPNRVCTYTSAKRIIDANLNAFPNVQQTIAIASFDQQTIGVDANAIPDPNVGYYALTATNARGQIGWRRDSWGAASSAFPWYGWNLEQNNAKVSGVTFNTLIMNKWKYAPIGGEPYQCCTINGGSEIYWDLENEATTYHMTYLGNGNLENPTSTSTITHMQAAGHAMGHRIIATNATIPSSIQNNTSFQIIVNWQNIGLTPPYYDWNVVFELRNTNNNIAVWSGTSSKQLRLFLPSTSATPTTDTFSITGIVANTYKLVMIIKDANNYMAPMKLGITGIQSDGSYILSNSIQVI